MILESAGLEGVFLLLFIGMGFKIALTPFMKLTSNLEVAQRRKIVNTMVATSTSVALVLLVFGKLLMLLFHVSREALLIAAGLIFLILAWQMLKGIEISQPENIVEEKIAFYPLAVPYLLNPAGIAIIILLSATVDSLLSLLIVAGFILLVGASNLVIFRNAAKMDKAMQSPIFSTIEYVSILLLFAISIEMILVALDSWMF